MADISQIELPNGNTYDINATTVNKHTVASDVPANAVFTDTKVTQTQDDSTNNNFEILLAGSTSTSTATEGAKKSSSLMLNPAKASMSVGVDSIASGVFSYAQGNNVVASGESSHAQGDNTIANNFAQSVFGAYNIEDTTPIGESGLLEIVGNGNIGKRSNARTLDWNGNEVLSGKLTVGTAPTNNMDVTTKLYVDTELQSKANANSVYTKIEADTLLDTKQDTLSASGNIQLQNNVISRKEVWLNSMAEYEAIANPDPNTDYHVPAEYPFPTLPLSIVNGALCITYDDGR